MAIFFQTKFIMGLVVFFLNQGDHLMPSIVNQTTLLVKIKSFFYSLYDLEHKRISFMNDHAHIASYVAILANTLGTHTYRVFVSKKNSTNLLFNT